MERPEQQRRLRDIADPAPFIIWMTDLSGYCHYINPAWTEFTGQSQEDGLGDGWLKMVHPTDKNRCQENFATCLKEQAPCRLVYQLYHNSDTYSWVTDTGRPYIDATGICYGYVGTVSVEKMGTDLHWPEKPLTVREKEILQLLAAGKTASEVATILSISARTIEFHVSEILIKTNSVNRVQAVVEAIRTGQISI